MDQPETLCYLLYQVSMIQRRSSMKTKDHICTMLLLCCCGVSEVANLFHSVSLLCCVCLPPGITTAEMPLLSFVRPSVFDITIALPWSYSGSLVPSCWGSCSVPLVLTCVSVSCVLCCLCCPLCVCWYRVYMGGGARSPPYGSRACLQICVLSDVCRNFSVTKYDACSW